MSLTIKMPLTTKCHSIVMSTTTACLFVIKKFTLFNISCQGVKTKWNLVIEDFKTECNLVVGDVKMEWNLRIWQLTMCYCPLCKVHHPLPPTTTTTHYVSLPGYFKLNCTSSWYTPNTLWEASYLIIWTTKGAFITTNHAI